MTNACVNASTVIRSIILFDVEPFLLSPCKIRLSSMFCRSYSLIPPVPAHCRFHNLDSAGSAKRSLNKDNVYMIDLCLHSETQRH